MVMMRGAVRRGAVTATIAIGALLAAPAGAQTGPSTTTTTTTTFTGPAPPTTTPADPGVVGDAPPESVPDTPDTVPPREAAPGDPAADAVSPRPGYVVRIDARAARASAAARQAAWEAAVARRTDLEQSLAALQDKVGKLDAANRKAVRDLADAKVTLRDRAVAAYVRGSGFDEAALDVTSSEADAQRATLMTAVVRRDRAAVDTVRDLQAKLTKEQAQAAKDLTDTQSLLDQARVDETQAQLDLFDAKLELAVSGAGGSIVIHGFVFPVADPHTFAEDFGDPRLPDTEFAHTHQGCDVVAAEGTELYAAERGVITQISDSYLGGRGLWLKGESNTSYYYAHLSGYAPGLRQGQVVEAGDLVGYVGHTGDAYGPHLHFEVHPNGGAAIDPYPLLLVADRQDSTTP
jgi:murein DD-endopeptidase MepM/ murein hydrolase activator NlpD